MTRALDPSFLAFLAAAFAGSFHCSGMCGGFVLAAAASARGRRGALLGLFASQSLYHGGRTATYLFLGALASSSGLAAARAGSAARVGLGLLAGLLLVAVGLGSLGAGRWTWRRGRRDGVRIGSSFLRAIGRERFARWMRAVALLDSPLTPLYLGALSGFLPCPLVYAFLASAAAAPGIAAALGTMAALGLGTLPLLAAVALTGHGLSPLLRARLAQASGVLLVALGAWTWYRSLVGAALPCCVEAAAGCG